MCAKRRSGAVASLLLAIAPACAGRSDLDAAGLPLDDAGTLILGLGRQGSACDGPGDGVRSLRFESAALPLPSPSHRVAVFDRSEPQQAVALLDPRRLEDLELPAGPLRCDQTAGSVPLPRMAKTFVAEIVDGKPSDWRAADERPAIAERFRFQPSIRGEPSCARQPIARPVIAEGIAREVGVAIAIDEGRAVLLGAVEDGRLFRVAAGEPEATLLPLPVRSSGWSCGARGPRDRVWLGSFDGAVTQLDLALGLHELPRPFEQAEGITSIAATDTASVAYAASEGGRVARWDGTGWTEIAPAILGSHSSVLAWRPPDELLQVSQNGETPVRRLRGASMEAERIDGFDPVHDEVRLAAEIPGFGVVISGSLGGHEVLFVWAPDRGLWRPFVDIGVLNAPVRDLATVDGMLAWTSNTGVLGLITPTGVLCPPLPRFTAANFHRAVALEDLLLVAGFAEEAGERVRAFWIELRRL